MEAVFVSGYAKFPKDITGSEIYNEVGIGLIIDKKSSLIKDVDCTLVTETGKKFISELLIGQNLLKLDSIIEELNDNYYGHAKNAIIAAIKSARKQYLSKSELAQE